MLYSATAKRTFAETLRAAKDTCFNKTLASVEKYNSANNDANMRPLNEAIRWTFFVADCYSDMEGRCEAWAVLDKLLKSTA